MQGTTVGVSAEPSGATVSITGRTEGNPFNAFIELTHRTLCRVAINGFSITAYDAIAKEMSLLLPNTLVRIEGHLVKHEWSTGENRLRRTLAIEADAIAVLDKPRKEVT